MPTRSRGACDAGAPQATLKEAVSCRQRQRSRGTALSARPNRSCPTEDKTLRAGVVVSPEWPNLVLSSHILRESTSTSVSYSMPNGRFKANTALSRPGESRLDTQTRHSGAHRSPATPRGHTTDRFPKQYATAHASAVSAHLQQRTQTLNRTFLYCTVSTLNPTVGMVVTGWPSFNL